MIGYHPWSCGQPDSVQGGIISTNWEQPDRSKISVGDYNPQAVDRFRQWLRKKYHDSPAALRQAWKDNDVTFETARPVISQLVKEGVGGGVFRDPAVDGMAPFDYLEFWPTLLGDWHSMIAGTIKEETHGESLVLIHYGAILAFLQAAQPGGRLHNNNFDLVQRLNDPNIDGYVQASLYEFRHAGQPHVVFPPYSSMTLHGRIFLADDDMRTFTSGTPHHGRHLAEQETEAMVLRNLGWYAATRTGAWMADMGRRRANEWTAQGHPWYAHPSTARAFKSMSDLLKEEFKHPHKPATEIAVFVSCDASRYGDAYRMAPIYHNVINRMVYQRLNQLGAPYDIYLMDDLDHPRIRKNYKLYVFLNPFMMTDRQRAAVDALKSGDRTLLWFYAPGYIRQEQGCRDEHVSETTGMIVRQKPGKEHLRMRVTDPAASPITRRIEAGREYVTEGYGDNRWGRMHPITLGPVFYVDDPAAQPLAEYPDGRTAFAARDFGNWKSVYCAVPYLDGDALRGVARYAGVNIYVDEDIVMAADSRLLMLHNGFEQVRRVTVRLPCPRTVADALSGELIAENRRRFNIALPRCTTLILRLSGDAE